MDANAALVFGRLVASASAAVTVALQGPRNRPATRRATGRSVALVGSRGLDRLLGPLQEFLHQVAAALLAQRVHLVLQVAVGNQDSARPERRVVVRRKA